MVSYFEADSQFIPSLRDVDNSHSSLQYEYHRFCSKVLSNHIPLLTPPAIPVATFPVKYTRGSNRFSHVTKTKKKISQCMREITPQVCGAMRYTLEQQMAIRRLRQKTTYYFKRYGMERKWPTKSKHNLDLPGSGLHYPFGQPMDWSANRVYATALLNGFYVVTTNDSCAPEGSALCLWDSTNPRGLFVDRDEAEWRDDRLNIPIQAASHSSTGFRQSHVTAVQFAKVCLDIIAIGFEAGIIEIWGLGSLKEYEEVQTHSRSLRFKKPLCRSCDALLDVRFVDETANYCTSAITCFAWHPNEMTLASGSYEGPVIIWKFVNKSFRHSPNFVYLTKDFYIYPSGAPSNYRSPIEMIQVHCISPARLSSVLCIAWHMNENFMGIGTSSGSIGVWNYQRAIKYGSAYNKLVSASASFGKGKRHADSKNYSYWSTLRSLKEQIKKRNSNNFSTLEKAAGCHLSRPTKSIFTELDSFYLPDGGKAELGVLTCIPKAHSGIVRCLLWNIHDNHILLSGGGSESDGCIRLWRISEIGNYTALFAIDVNSQVTSMLWSNLTKELLVSHSSNKDRPEIHLHNASNISACTSPTGGRWGISVWRYCSVDECVYKVGEFGNHPFHKPHHENSGNTSNVMDRDNAHYLLQSTNGRYIVYWSLPLEHVTVWETVDFLENENSFFNLNDMLKLKRDHLSVDKNVRNADFHSKLHLRKDGILGFQLCNDNILNSIR